MRNGKLFTRRDGRLICRVRHWFERMSSTFLLRSTCCCLSSITLFLMGGRWASFCESLARFMRVTLRRYRSMSLYSTRTLQRGRSSVFAVHTLHFSEVFGASRLLTCRRLSFLPIVYVPLFKPIAVAFIDVSFRAMLERSCEL